MSDFTLTHIDSSGGQQRPANLVAIGIGQSGGYSWTGDLDIMGHDCASPREWDEMVDRLIRSLEKVRAQGHVKLAANRDVGNRH